MTSVVLAGKRAVLMISTWASLLSIGSVSTALQNWRLMWTANRAQIFVMTGVNTTITTGTEFVTRTVSAPVTRNPASTAFFVTPPQGGISVNRQSLINIWMTIFASLFGGVVFFIDSRFKRFLFFVGFGTASSFFSQSLSALIRDGFVVVAGSRLLFDFAYNGTMKFMIFEWGRRPINRACRKVLNASRRKILNIGGIRLGQDFCTTSVRVTLLNLCGFRG